MSELTKQDVISTTAPTCTMPMPGGCNKKNLWWKILIAITTALASVFGLTACLG